MEIGGTYIIDFAKVSKIPKFNVNIKSGDRKRTIKLILLKNSEALNLNNYTVVVAAKKTDGKVIFNDAKVIDAINGMCEVEITEQMLALNMDLPCEIVLYNSSGAVASSSDFVISKISSLKNEESIASSNEFKALTTALSNVLSIDIEFNNINSILESKLDKNGEISVNQINKNKGKIDETFLSETLINQIAGTTPVNNVLADSSIVNTKLTNNCVSSYNVDFFVNEMSDNVLNLKHVTNFGYVLGDSGEYTVNSDGCVSGYIRVSEGDVIRSNSNWNGAYYDKDMRFILRKDFGTNESTAPRGSAFYRQSLNNKTLNTAMITINKPLPEQYVEFAKFVDFDDEFKNILDKNINNISPAKTDFLKLDTSENLFNKNKVTDYFVLNNKGTLEAHESGCVSDYIKVEPSEFYEISSNWNGAFYDKNKAFVSEKPFGVTRFEIPKNCHYLRLSVNIKDSYMCVKGNLPSDYIPYYKDLSFSKEYNLSKIKKQLSKLNGMKWVALGDSLTEKNIRTTKNYHDYIAEETGVNVHNMGVGGTGYMRTQELGKAFYQRIENIPTDADIITIFGSGNDMPLIGKLGNPSDNTTDTICGCVNETLKRLFNRIPGARVGIVLPCPWGNYPPSQVDNHMAKYSKALKEIAKRHSVPVLDLYHGSNLRPWDTTFKELYYKRDDNNSVHPDEDGHKILYRKFLSFIESL